VRRSPLTGVASIALPVCALLGLAAGQGDAARGSPASTRTCALQIPNRLQSANPRASTRLVPPGARVLLLCRYDGLNAGPNTGWLAAEAWVDDASTIVRLTREFDLLSPATERDLLPRRRRQRHPRHLRLRRCAFGPGAGRAEGMPHRQQRAARTVSNGRLIRTAISPVGARLVQQLKGLQRPAETVAPDPCTSSQLALSVQTQGENTAAWIGVTVQNRGRACTITSVVGRVRLLIEVSGGRAEVAGNPLTLLASGRLAHGGTDLLIADWSNWCGPRRAIRLAIILARATTRARFSVLPVCLQRAQRSRFVAVR
jgi:hypothetical protein